MAEKVTGEPPAGREVDIGLLELLVCPVSGGALRYDRAAAELVCEASGLAYPVRDGIPVMLPEEARRLDASPAAAASPTGE